VTTLSVWRMRIIPIGAKNRLVEAMDLEISPYGYGDDIGEKVNEIARALKQSGFDVTWIVRVDHQKSVETNLPTP